MPRSADPFTRPTKAEKRIPFAFILDALEACAPETRAMFGSTGVYVRDRIVFILRDKGEHDSDKGAWVAYQPESEAEVLALFPALTKIDAFVNDVRGWKKLAATSPDFEGDVLAICRRIRASDPRFGKVPGAKKKAAKKKTPAKKAQRPK